MEEANAAKIRVENERNTLLEDVARGGYAATHVPAARPQVYDLSGEDADGTQVYDLAEEDDDMCLQHVLAAWMAERNAMDLDKDGDVFGALDMYEECERELDAAASTAERRHADDHERLVEHRQNVLARMAYLRSLSPSLHGTEPSVAIDQHIRAVELNMHSKTQQSTAFQSLGSQASSSEPTQST